MEYEIYVVCKTPLMSKLLVRKHAVDFFFMLTLFIIVIQIYVQSFSRSGKRMPGLLGALAELTATSRMWSW